jgi:uncharacterized alpha-E superfamily protein
VIGAQAFALYETAAALERAEASARVLAARAQAGRRGADGAAVFAALAACAPEGLVPARGAGGAHLRRSLDQAAEAGVAAGAALPEEVLDALARAVAETTRHAGGSGALDPQETARTVRRAIAAVRGLAVGTMSRDGAWELLRLGTFLPRAGWLAALLSATARLAAQANWSDGAAWAAAAAIAGTERALGEPGLARDHAAEILLRDPRFPCSVAFALAEVEAAVFGLGQGGPDAGPGLALARSALARLYRPEAAQAMAGGRMGELMDDVLDAIGAVAAAAAPRRSPIPPGSLLPPLRPEGATAA